jgi:glycosyltransferase involved in cell wall biosynthesis
MNKILFILHLPPPNHGAAKVGEIIKNSKVINENFECRFIPIKSSKTIGDIGKINFEKITLAKELKKRIEKELNEFKPDKIYYTPSTGLVGFLRDFYVTLPIRKYKTRNKHVEIFYHYHTKGLDRLKKVNFLLKRFLLGVNIIIVGSRLKEEFLEYSIKKIYILPNGVEDRFKNQKQKIKKAFLYMNHLIDMKGYKEVLKLAKNFPKYKFNFAGNFGGKEDEKYFFEFIRQYNLRNVVYHGFVKDQKKDEFFRKNDGLIFLTKNDIFGLVIIEAFSYGLPVFTTNQGAIPEIVDENVGMINESLDEDELIKNFEKFIKMYINEETFEKCKEKYLKNYTIEKFENNLKGILDGNNGL